MALDSLPADKLEIIRRELVDAGSALLAAPRRDDIQFTADPIANAMVNDLDGLPHAFVFASLVDRQVSADLAWRVPLRIRERLGSFAFDKLADLSEPQWVQILSEPQPAHRFPATMGVVLHRATARIAEHYGGDAARIWSDVPPSSRLVRRFLEFHGAGPKIATMASNILVRDFRIDVADHRYIDVSADVQVVRVMARLGLVRNGAGEDEVIYAARELNPEFPGIFDLPLWELGRTICRPRGPRCDVCFLRGCCAYRIGLMQQAREQRSTE